MHFLIAGASGFLGTRLSRRLVKDGHDVTALVRRTPGSREVRWDPYSGALDTRVLDDVDVVVNLAGSPTFGNPHSKGWARRLRSSRVTTTRVLAEAIAASDRGPAFLAGNAVGVYGDHGDEALPESAASRGDSLMTGVTRGWEAAAEPAAAAGGRVAVLRTAPVLDRRGAPLKQQVLLFKAGLGGPIGDGRQYFPVISLRDWLDAAVFVAVQDLHGPVNLCCPVTPTNAEFTAELADQLHRPAFLRVPAAVIKAAAGPLAPEALGSMRVVPKALLDAGFSFADETVRDVLRSGLAAAGR